MSKKTSYQPNVEHLETRELLASGLSFSGGIVRIYGDNGENHATVKQSGSNIIITTESWNRSFNRTSVSAVAFYGKGGNDEFYNNTSVRTYAWGDAGNDILVANSGWDKLYGGSGNDILKGHSGNDTLKGGSGNDYIDAGHGSDKIWGNDGNDTIYAGTGNDTIDGGRGSDHMRGEDGHDKITAGEWVYRNSKWSIDYSSSTDRDTLIGGEHNDTFFGGKGADYLEGNGGNDYLRGSAGNDTIEGGTGNDTLRGGLGNDLLVFQGNRNLGADHIPWDQRYRWNNQGVDTMDFRNFHVGTGISLNLAKTGHYQELNNSLKLKFDGNGAVDHVFGT